MIGPLPEFLQCLPAAVAGTGPLHRVSPVPKVVFTLAFLMLTVSFGRYGWRGCLLFAAVPFLLAAAGRLPVRNIFMRTLAALPFVLCAGVANCFFDRAPVEFAAGFRLPGGILSLFVLILKTLATVGLAQVLAASTPLSGIAGALRSLHVPCILILQLQLLFRYLALMMEEARNVMNAYFLRNPSRRTVPLHDWGALVGRLFLRTVERAGAVYRAMQCRLFHAGRPLPAAAKGSPAEWGGTVIALLFLLILRCSL